ncbi:unnamed protein product, partial [Prorocentrum cordatum]
AVMVLQKFSLQDQAAFRDLRHLAAVSWLPSIEGHSFWVGFDAGKARGNGAKVDWSARGLGPPRGRVALAAEARVGGAQCGATSALNLRAVLDGELNVTNEQIQTRTASRFDFFKRGPGPILRAQTEITTAAILAVKMVTALLDDRGRRAIGPFPRGLLWRRRQAGKLEGASAKTGPRQRAPPMETAGSYSPVGARLSARIYMRERSRPSWSAGEASWMGARAAAEMAKAAALPRSARMRREANAAGKAEQRLGSARKAHEAKREAREELVEQLAALDTELEEDEEAFRRLEAEIKAAVEAERLHQAAELAERSHVPGLLTQFRGGLQAARRAGNFECAWSEIEKQMSAVTAQLALASAPPRESWADRCPIDDELDINDDEAPLASAAEKVGLPRGQFGPRGDCALADWEGAAGVGQAGHPAGLRGSGQEGHLTWLRGAARWARPEDLAERGPWAVPAGLSRRLLGVEVMMPSGLEPMVASAYFEHVVGPRAGDLDLLRAVAQLTMAAGRMSRLLQADFNMEAATLQAWSPNPRPPVELAFQGARPDALAQVTNKPRPFPHRDIKACEAQDVRVVLLKALGAITSYAYTRTYFVFSSAIIKYLVRMLCVRSLKASIFALVSSQVVGISVNGVGTVRVRSRDVEWLKGVSVDGDNECSVEDECIVGSGLGKCTVMVDPAKTIPLGSTDAGYHSEFIFNSTTVSQAESSRYPTPISDITIAGHSHMSHWNLCWKSNIDRNALREKRVEDYCYHVNGICFLWASPCSGGCSKLEDLTSYSSFCPGLRYATSEEFSSALPALNAGRDEFYKKCAASRLDPWWNHCDYGNNFGRVE